MAQSVAASPTRSAGLTEISVDYALVGLATRFAVPVTRSERSQISVGDEVTLVGDTVEPRSAVIRGWCDEWTIDVEFVD